jgi:hypothetical protein
MFVESNCFSANTYDPNISETYFLDIVLGIALHMFVTVQLNSDKLIIDSSKKECTVRKDTDIAS